MFSISLVENELKWELKLVNNKDFLSFCWISNSLTKTLPFRLCFVYKCKLGDVSLGSVSTLEEDELYNYFSSKFWAVDIPIRWHVKVYWRILIRRVVDVDCRSPFWPRFLSWSLLKTWKAGLGSWYDHSTLHTQQCTFHIIIFCRVESTVGECIPFRFTFPSCHYPTQSSIPLCCFGLLY
jgi:hypothetical protein